MKPPWPTTRPCPISLRAAPRIFRFFPFTRDPPIPCYLRGAVRCGTQFHVCLKGGVNSLLVTPVELVRTRLMLQFDRDPRSNPSSIKGPVDCIRRIVRRSGVRSMWQASARAAWRRGQGRVFQADENSGACRIPGRWCLRLDSTSTRNG